MRHWASTYVGAGYDPNGNGPRAYSCWGLVRRVFADVYKIDFPAVQVRADDVSPVNLENVSAIKQAARVSGMRPIPGRLSPVDGDIVLMRSNVRLHCGVVVWCNLRIQVLHAAHDTGVIVEPWVDAICGMTPELWRRSS